MPLKPSDLRFFLSVRTAMTGYEAASTPALSLGGFLSITEVGDTLFSDTTAGAGISYRCVFLANLHTTLPLLNPAIYLDITDGAQVAVGLDLAPPSPVFSALAIAAEIPNETFPPVGVVFHPGNSAQRLMMPIPAIPAGSCQAFWVCRSPGTGTATTAGCTFGVQGTTDLHLMTRAL